MADYGKLNFSVAFNPTSAFPLDARCYFTNLADAQRVAATSEEVGSTNTVYYYGQKLVVVANNKVTWYTIQPDKTLKEDGVADIGTAADSEKLGGQLPSYYAKATDIPKVPTDISAFNNDKGYLTEHQSLEGYAKNTDIPTVPTKVSAFENDKGYLTEHQSLEGYAKASELEDAVEEMTAVAQGKCACYVFDTVDALDLWLSNTENTAKLQKGDVFLIRAVNVPDYWWDGSTKQILETTKVDLTDYAKTSDIPSLDGYAKNTDIPTALSQLSQDATHRIVTDTEKATWNAKSNFSGNYNDLSNKPTIPTVPSSLPANGGNADTVDGYHIRTGISGAAGYITFVV